MRFLIWCLLILAWVIPARSQQHRAERPLSNLRLKTVSTHTPAVQIDTQSIIPGTFSVVGLPDTLFTVDYINATLSWKKALPFDSVQVRYRVFSRRLNAVARHMQFDSVMNNFMGQTYTPQYATETEDRFFDFGNISYSGSFGRGISFGNSQDAVVTSNLNLQISGYLADSVGIVAAITDNNIPIQPDGTTQQLNEFDRIFLQFRKKNWALSLGDIDIRQNQSYFLSFYKRLQGISFETRSELSPAVSNNAIVSGSIAKGKFTTNILQPLEGNQGPYRLQGANNEFFFVVLANTERVYMDGELLQRGEDQDYVINYNTAEIAFTPRRMVTKDKRIQVDFEYSDRNYLNANLYGFDEAQVGKKLRIRVGAFSNTDAKNSPINQTLNADQKHFLDTLGNNIRQAFYPYAVADTFSAGKILYQKIDTVYNGGASHDSVYVYSTASSGPLYSLSFIDVGAGSGNYVPLLNGANGKVYQWIAPVNGIRQGNYEPAVFLVTPKKQQVVSVGADYTISSHTSATVEGAASNYDVNSFSTRDKGQDQGFAGKVSLRQVNTLRRGKLSSDAGFEYVQARFRPLERLRNVEFTRDWGLPLVVSAADERIITLGTQLEDARSNLLRYQFTTYQRSDGFSGFRNTITQSQDVHGWKLNNVLNLSQVSSTSDKGYFFRPSLNVTRTLARLRNYQLNVGYSIEHNEVHNKMTDSVSPQSFSFDVLQAAIRSPQARSNHWGVSYFTRANAYPSGVHLLRSDRSHNVTVSTDLMANERHQFRFNGTYRTLHVFNALVPNQRSDNSLLGRAEYQVNEWKGLLAGNVLYEVGAGQEQKRDFAFLEVPAGQGEYTWIDYNNDGIQELNEFEVALFQDQAKYIRIFTPTNQYVKANYNTLNYSISLNPRSVIDLKKVHGLTRLLSNTNFQSALQINKKEVARGLVEFNPFRSVLNDTSLITLTSILTNTVSYNRFSSRWGADLVNVKNGSKALLTYGYETRRQSQWTLKGRYNFTRSILFELSGQTGLNELTTSSAKFDNRNYRVRLYAAEPRLSVTRGGNFRVMLGYRFSDKRNGTGSFEHSVSNAVNTEIKYNILQSTSLQGRFTYNNISYTSATAVPNPNSTAGYIILEGLLPGRNYLWNLDVSKRLSGNLEMNIQYEGRKPGEAHVVHVGRASIRALL